MKTILLVDDDPAILESLAMRLQQHGYVTLTALDGLTAIARAREDHPDAIIMDVRLPPIGGCAVLRALRKDQRTEAIPVLALSGLDSERDRTLAAGAAAFLGKPFEGRQLLELLRSVLQSAPQARTDLLTPNAVRE